MVVPNVRHSSASEELRKGKSAETAPRAEESGAEKKDTKENQIKRTKSRELRGGIMYYSCHCIKRNGLQHDCRRTGCGGEPACLALPDPLCAPSQLARARGLADPAPLAAHFHAQSGGSTSTDPATGSGSGKRFIVCELKSMIPDVSSNKPGQCCKFSKSVDSEIKHLIAPHNEGQKMHTSKCSCSCNTSNKAIPFLMFDQVTTETILNRFQNKDLISNTPVLGPGGRPQKLRKTAVVEECTRPGCVHWKPPPPCLWSAPCKADCFETPPGIHPFQHQTTGSDGSSLPTMLTTTNERTETEMILLTPKH